MKNIKQIGIHIITSGILSIPAFVYGQTVTIPNPLAGGNTTLMQVITTILNRIVMPIAAVAVVMWIVYAGFTFLTAQGKPAEIQKAQQRLLWSLIGAGILLGAAAISTVVCNTVAGLTTMGNICP